MSKKNKKDSLIAAIDKADVDSGEITIDEITTKKKLLKKAEQAVRDLDNVITDLYKVREDAHSLINGSLAPQTDFATKDLDRFEEIFTVVDGSVGILYQLTKRMARKYVGTEIEDIEDLDSDRKSLKN